MREHTSALGDTHYISPRLALRRGLFTTMIKSIQNRKKESGSVLMNMIENPGLVRSFLYLKDDRGKSQSIYLIVFKCLTTDSCIC
jgi:hypothetical protein